MLHRRLELGVDLFACQARARLGNRPGRASADRSLPGRMLSGRREFGAYLVAALAGCMFRVEGGAGFAVRGVVGASSERCRRKKHSCGAKRCCEATAN